MDSDDEAPVVALSKLSTAASAPRNPPSLQEAAERLAEHWEDFAAMAESARGLSRLEALQSILPHAPDGPAWPAHGAGAAGVPGPRRDAALR